MTGQEKVAQIQAKAKKARQYLRVGEAGVYFNASIKNRGVVITEVAVGGATKRSTWQANRVVGEKDWSSLDKIERFYSYSSCLRNDTLSPEKAQESLASHLSKRAKKLEKEAREARTASDIAQYALTLPIPPVEQ